MPIGLINLPQVSSVYVSAAAHNNLYSAHDRVWIENFNIYTMPYEL